MSCGTPRRANHRSMSRRSSGGSVGVGGAGVVTAGAYSMEEAARQNRPLPGNLAALRFVPGP